jgi:peptidoglycan/LPS O-acetylase OafA/YrhL
MKYRHEIDGLRALAVIPVILFHANSDFFSGGFVGVDVFFVISGYLISQIVISEVYAGTFSIMHFYERRARRILPALFFLLLVVTPLSWLTMMPHQFKDYSESVVAVSLFSANVLFWLESGYFELASELKPLLHTWSLAVEEQFYFVFPIAVLIICRYFRKALFFVFILIFFASLGLAQSLSESSPNANFYLPFSRAWELIWGSTTAMYVARYGLPRFRHSNLLSVFGIGMILLSVFLLDRTTPFPGIYALPTVVGTAMVILFGNQDTVVGKALSFKPSIAIGRISYSLYLWHFSVFALARLYLNTEPSKVLFAFLIAAVFPISYLSYRFVETPFRDKTKFSRMSIFAASMCGVILFVSLGYYGHQNNGFLEYKLAQIPESRQHLLIDIKKERDAREKVWRPLLREASRPFDSARETAVLILGDSVSEDLYVALSIDNEEFSNFSFRRLSLDDTCMKYLYDSPPASSICQSEVSAIRSSQLSTDAAIVLVSATWQQHTVKDITEVLRYFDRPDVTVIVVGSANFNDVASLSYQIARQDIPKQDWGRFFAGNKRDDWNAQNRRLQSVLVEADTAYISKYDAFCHGPHEQEECELFTDGGNALIYDTGHLTVAGARFLGARARELDWLPK